MSKVREYELELIGVDGRPHKMTALERTALELRIPPVTLSTIERQQHGIVLGDKCEVKDVEILIGADWANKLQHERVKNGNEFAYRIDFRWVLSGQSLEVQKQDTLRVSYVKATLDVLWELEVPVGKGSNWPEFPMSLADGMFVVGLLWRSEERPSDNRQRASVKLINS